MSFLSGLKGALGSIGNFLGGNPIVDTITNVATPFINRAWNKRDARTQQDYAMDRMGMQNYLNENMYLKYQSPKAMMQQFKDAGLNPNLIYGHAGGSPDGVSMATPIGSPSNNFDIGNPANQYLNYANRKQEMDLKKYEFDKMKEREETTNDMLQQDLLTKQKKNELLQLQINKLKNGKIEEYNPDNNPYDVRTIGKKVVKGVRTFNQVSRAVISLKSFLKKFNPDREFSLKDTEKMAKGGFFWYKNSDGYAHYTNIDGVVKSIKLR